ncbi:hypothetical protein A0G02_13190 [Pectobacterium peruviense]|nr:hypothetical protein A0G02_13190 [Pectobacterium peruviense]
MFGNSRFSYFNGISPRNERIQQQLELTMQGCIFTAADAMKTFSGKICGNIDAKWKTMDRKNGE